MPVVTPSRCGNQVRISRGSDGCEMPIPAPKRMVSASSTANDGASARNPPPIATSARPPAMTRAGPQLSASQPPGTAVSPMSSVGTATRKLACANDRAEIVRQRRAAPVRGR